MTKCFFITGSDTNIGKTLSACALLQSAARAGCRVVGYKPVASGCKVTPEGLRNGDALALMANSNVAITYHQINPLAFLEATAPHIASFEEGKTISLSELSAGLHSFKNIADWVVIEGAGGWFTPLGETLTYADWVIAEKLPVILVVAIKLGCINHALLTALAVSQARLRLVGWIANHPEPATYRSQDYLTALKNRLDAPFLGAIPWLRVVKPVLLADYLDVSSLKEASLN